MSHDSSAVTLLKRGNGALMEGRSLGTSSYISLKTNLSSAEADVGGETDRFRPLPVETSLKYCGVPHPKPGRARGLILLGYPVQKTSPTAEGGLIVAVSGAQIMLWPQEPESLWTNFLLLSPKPKS